MTFIITLIALLIERFFHWHHVRRWQWFVEYESWITRYWHALPASFILIINLIIPLIIILLIEHLVRGWLYGVLELIFGLVVLLYCLGPENVWVQVYQVIQLKSTDFNQASQLVQKEFGVPELPFTSFQQAWVGAIFVAAYERIFSVIFWFVLLGPLGAVFYRLVELFSKNQEEDIARRAAFIKKWLDWFPVRFFAFIFALAGHFTQAFSCFKEKFSGGIEVNKSLLAECGRASLDINFNDIDETNNAEIATLALLDRVFAIVLFLLAVIVLVAHVLFS